MDTTNLNGSGAQNSGCTCGHDQKSQDSGAGGGCCGETSHAPVSDRDPGGCCGGHKPVKHVPHHGSSQSATEGNHS